MSTFESGSIEWLDDIVSLEAELQAKPAPKKKDLGKNLGLDRTVAQRLVKIGSCLDSEARNRIRQAAQIPSPQSGQKPYIFSYTSVKALSGLKGRGQQGSGLKKENRKPQD